MAYDLATFVDILAKGAFFMNGGSRMMCLIALAVICIFAIVVACYIDSGTNE